MREDNWQEENQMMPWSWGEKCQRPEQKATGRCEDRFGEDGDWLRPGGAGRCVAPYTHKCKPE